jgi:hypothetical protein
MTDDQPKRPFFSRRRAFVLVGFAVLLLVVIALLFAHRAPPLKKLNITVTFLGCTNAPDGTRLGTFAIANLSHKTVTCSDYCSTQPQELTALGLTDFRYIRPSVPTFTNSLSRGQSQVIYLEAATNNLPWRADFVFYEPGLRVNFAILCANHNLGVFKSMIPKKWQDVNYEESSSHWINPEVPPAKP